MAFSSLNYMTVPASDNAKNGEGILMPKLQFRFRIIFVNFGVSQATHELTKQVMDFTRPSVSFPEIPLEIYNSRVYLAGKPVWEAVSVNVRDDATGQVARLVGEQIQKQFDFSEQASAAAGNDYKFHLRCQILDGGNGAFEPAVLEEWDLYGCYLASANYNTLNYGTNDAVSIALSIRFDNAVQAPTESGLGGGVGVGVANAFGKSLGSMVSGIGSA